MMRKLGVRIATVERDVVAEGMSEEGKTSHPQHLLHFSFVA